MRVTRAKAAENRSRILDIAGRRFREKGFDGIGVADLMSEAGLTHGGFYGHFASKEDLAAEASMATLAASAGRWERLAANAPDDPFRAIVESYVSARHRDNPAGGCSLAALGADVARHPGPVRRAFANGLRPLADILTKVAPGRSKAARRERALATMAGLVGAIVLARAVDDPALSDEILTAAAATYGGKARAAAMPARRKN